MVPTDRSQTESPGELRFCSSQSLFWETREVVMVCKGGERTRGVLKLRADGGLLLRPVWRWLLLWICPQRGFWGPGIRERKRMVPGSVRDLAVIRVDVKPTGCPAGQGGRCMKNEAFLAQYLGEIRRWKGVRSALASCESGAGGGELRLFKVWGRTGLAGDHTINNATLDTSKCYGALKLCWTFTFLPQNVHKLINLNEFLSSSLFCP